MHSSDFQQGAAQAVETLLGYYPTIQASDPQVFVAGLVRLFLNYPPHLWQIAIDPVSGLPGRHKFAPNVAEVREFLEPIYRDELRRKERVERFSRAALPPPLRDKEFDSRMAENFKNLSEFLKARASDGVENGQA